MVDQQSTSSTKVFIPQEVSFRRYRVPIPMGLRRSDFGDACRSELAVADLPIGDAVTFSARIASAQPDLANACSATQVTSLLTGIKAARSKA